MDEGLPELQETDVIPLYLDKNCQIYQTDGIEFLKALPTGGVQLIWTDPPYGTGNYQKLDSTVTTTGPLGYKDVTQMEAVELSVAAADAAAIALSPTGVLAMCLDYRSVHHVISAVTKGAHLQFGGEIIHHFELGGVSKSWWTNKHNTIALFHKGNPKFEVDRVPMTIRKAPRGDYHSAERKVNSVWDYTMGSSDPERTGYPNQKPMAIITPFILVHTDPGDIVVDPFCGSGSTMEAAVKAGRVAIVNDSNPEAVAITIERYKERCA